MVVVRLISVLLQQTCLHPRWKIGSPGPAGAGPSRELTDCPLNGSSREGERRRGRGPRSRQYPERQVLKEAWNVNGHFSLDSAKSTENIMGHFEFRLHIPLGARYSISRTISSICISCTQLVVPSFSLE